ncbi:hypothetical protein [Micromonospora ureilytica]|uniref:Uncharacterized protein n=1 Tax=Micromonospora ureilytica TaxID=709868 RepID=A0ABS0JLC9_9ACTN|nr:hypothetical protein [Micromonospora ureilytica]MBG6067857.1 hypothetical protein [Micromonospora ureilytica]
MTHRDPVLGNTARPRPVLGDDLADMKRQRAITSDVARLAEVTGMTHGDALQALADADGNLTAALGNVVNALSGEQPPAEVAPPAPVDVRALARQIRNGTADSDARPDIRDLAKDIRR